MLDEIESAREGSADDAIADAVERASETLGELMRGSRASCASIASRSPGRPLRAAQYGGLLELVVRLGSAAAELLIEQMASAQRDVRFYATVCAAELRPRNAVFALVERLFDQDFGVRATAIEALAGYPIGDLSHALAKARRALHAERSRGRRRRDVGDRRARRHRGGHRSDRRDRARRPRRASTCARRWSR